MDVFEAELQLAALEPIFHRSPPGSARDLFERMTADDYWEVGASGTIYDRDTVLAVVVDRYATGHIDPEPLTVSDFSVARLDRDTWLATYRLAQGERLTRRATIWRHDGEQWQAVYHQGTVIAIRPIAHVVTLGAAHRIAP